MVRMPGLSAPVSALALGTADFTTAEEADPVYDDFVAAGGTLFDQQFPTAPLIGPLSRSELASSPGALDVALSESEVCWLGA